MSALDILTSPASDGSLSPLAEEAAAELAALRDELDDLKGYYKRVMAEKCPSDEAHCTCVPALRAELDHYKEVEAAYQLSVAEAVKATNERNNYRRNWEKTMEHRDRLSTECIFLRRALDEAREALELICDTAEHRGDVPDSILCHFWDISHNARAWLSAHPKEER